MIAALLGMRGYAYVALAAALAGFGYGTYREAIRFAQFEGGVEAVGKQAEQLALGRIQRNQKAKEETDDQARKDHAALQRTIERLRNERARSGSVPAAPAGASHPELACFDRAELTRAVGNLEAGVESLVAEGAAASADLDAAKRWAGKLSRQIAPERLAQADPGPP